MRREKVFDGKLLKVFRSTKRLPNGNDSYIEEVKHPGAAIVVPFVKNSILFIRQYRAVIEKYIWELPAGKLEPGETPYACMKREITEETGYLVRDLKRIGMIYTSPGFCDEIIHVFRADCISRGEHNRDADELIRIRHLSRKKARSLFRNGKITDSKTIAALAFAGVI